MLQMRQAVHDDFNGDGHLLFDLFRGAAWPLRDHLNVVVGHVRVGFDGQIAKRNDAPREQQNRDGRDQQPVIQGKVDQAPDHTKKWGAGSD